MNRAGLLLSVSVLVLMFVAEVRADGGGNPLMGKRLFAQCGACHTLAADGHSNVGPNLHGIFGRTAGAVKGFAYSTALQESNVVWNDRELNEFIQKPSAFIPGTKMVFLGVPKDQARVDIIAYLKEATR